MVPLVLSAAVPRSCEASRRAFALSVISFMVDLIVSRSVMVTLESSPISSFFLRSLSSTHTSRFPSASLPTIWILFLIFLLILPASLIPTAIHISMTTITDEDIEPKISLTTASFSFKLVPTKIIPII